MRAIADSHEVATAMKRVGPALSGRSDGGEVLLRASDGLLALEAQGEELGARHFVQLIELDESGSVSIPARYFQRFLSTIQGRVSFQVRDGSLVVSSGSTRATLTSLTYVPHFDLPSVEAVDIHADDVLKIRRVTHAAADVSTAPVLAAIRFDGHTAVATDRYRLAVAQLDSEVPACQPRARMVSTFLEDSGLSVSIGATDKLVVLHSEATTWVAPSMEGNYVDWASALPEPSSLKHSFRTGRRDLLEAARRVERIGLSAEDIAFARVTIEQCGTSGLRLRSTDAEVGELVDEVPGEMTMTSMSFNAAHLREALDRLEGEELVGRCRTEVGAVIFGDGVTTQMVMSQRM